MHNDNSSCRTVAACSFERQATYSAPTASRSCPIVSLRISSGGTRRFRAPKEIPLSSFNRSTCHSKRFSFFLNFTNLSRRSHLDAVMNLGALLLLFAGGVLTSETETRHGRTHDTVLAAQFVRLEYFTEKHSSQLFDLVSPNMLQSRSKVLRACHRLLSGGLCRL
jgi:hypothetical protein